MNKRRLWLLAISMATMVTANGVVMAATTDKQDIPTNKWQQSQSEKGDFSKRCRPPMGFHEDKKALLEFLKLDEQTFEAKVKDSKTLAEIAKDQGISEQSLTNFMVEQMTARIDKDEKEGRLPPGVDAAQMKANIEKHVADMINGKMPMHRPGHGPMHRAPFDDSKLLALLNLDREAFHTEIKAGKTLATIAQEHNVSEQQLTAFLTTQITERINEDVKAGRIPEERANQMKADMEKHITNMINGKAPQHGHHAMPPMGHSPFHNQQLLNLLNLSAENLKLEMDAGKSLLTIASERGVSEQSLKELLQQDMLQRLEQDVKDGRIPADKAEQMKANMDKHLDNIINNKDFMKHHRQAPSPQD